MTTPSGILTYNTPIPSSRYLSGGDAYPTKVGTRSVFVNKPVPNTGKKIEGFHWDDRVWADEQFENGLETLSVNFDASIENIPTTSFQSGIGCSRDILLEEVISIPGSGTITANMEDQWAPVVNHGYYFNYNEEGYLFSDDSEIVYGEIAHTYSETAGNFNYVVLPSLPKTGIPIYLRQFIWLFDEGRYANDTFLEKKNSFIGKKQPDGTRLVTVNDTGTILWDNIDQYQGKFIIQVSGGVATVILDGDWMGIVTETVGTGAGVYQLIHSSYAPLDKTTVPTITTENPITHMQQIWTPIDEDTTLSGFQVAVDYDLGTFTFGNSDGTGNVVPENDSIELEYREGFRVDYEPSGSSDIVIAIETNINPIYRTNNKGFVYLQNSEIYPASISLTANLSLSGGTYGPLYLGNPLTKLTATVFDKDGHPIEEQDVTFSFTSLPKGSLGAVIGNAETVIPTNGDGEAIAHYVPPTGTDDLGEYIDFAHYSTTGATTTLRSETLTIDGDVNDIYLYEVVTDDPVLGYRDLSISPDVAVQLSNYYTDYLANEDQHGPYTDGDAQIWEDTHRLMWGLLRPLIFEEGIGPGRKQLTAISSNNYLDPRTFQIPAIGPMRPSIVTNISGTEYDITYDTSYWTLPSSGIWGYFLIAPIDVKFQASVFNRLTNQSILSNEITIKIAVPPYMNGVSILEDMSAFTVEEISHILTGLVASGLTTGRIPFGFRLRSSTVTLAGALNGVIFLDKNNPTFGDPDPYVFTPGSGLGWF